MGIPDKERFVDKIYKKYETVFTDTNGIGGLMGMMRSITITESDFKLVIYLINKQKLAQEVRIFPTSESLLILDELTLPADIGKKKAILKAINEFISQYKSQYKTRSTDNRFNNITEICIPNQYKDMFDAIETNMTLQCHVQINNNCLIHVVTFSSFIKQLLSNPEVDEKINTEHIKRQETAIRQEEEERRQRESILQTVPFVVFGGRKRTRKSKRHARKKTMRRKRRSTRKSK
jgi:hypothetical protein